VIAALMLAAAAVARAGSPALRPIEVRASAAAIECAERQIPVFERALLPLVRDPAFLARRAPDTDEAEAAIVRCLDDAGTDAGTAGRFVRGYVASIAIRRALEQALGDAGIGAPTLDAIDADPEMRSLALTPSALFAFPDRLERLFRQFRIEPARRDQVVTYLTARRYARLSIALLRPPPDRADRIAGTIEPEDYPARTNLRGGEGDMLAVLEILPDGSIGLCWMQQVRRDDALAEAVCRAIRRRFRYAPAHDPQGRPVGDASAVRIDWRFPE